MTLFNIAGNIIGFFLLLFLIPWIILTIVAIFEVRRGVVTILSTDLSFTTPLPNVTDGSGDAPIEYQREGAHLSIKTWAFFLYERLKRQWRCYGLLVIILLLLMLTPLLRVDSLGDYCLMFCDWGKSGFSLFVMLYFYILVASLMLFDARYYLLPDPLNYLLLWGGIIAGLLGASSVTLKMSIIAIVVVYLLLWGLRTVYCCLGRKEALGLGDLKLSAALSAWVGLEASFTLLLLATLLALLYLGGQRFYGKVVQAIIPFGPFLGISGIIHYTLIFSFG